MAPKDETMMESDEKNDKQKEELPVKEDSLTPITGKAGLTKEDGINAFRTTQDKKHRPEDILYHNPDDIDNPEDIISG